MEPIEAIIGVSTFIFVLLSLIKPAKCNDDIVAEKMEGNRENSELYVIGENMYLKERKYKDFYLNVFRSRFVINLCSFEVQPKVFRPKFDKKFIKSLLTKIRQKIYSNRNSLILVTPTPV